MSNMLKILLTLVLFFISSLSVASATDSQWYWISVLNDPKTGYFIEEISPNTIGYTETNAVSSGNKTIVPENFMEIMEEAEDSRKCSGELDSAIKQLREFDSNNEILIPCLDVRCRENYIGPNLKTIEKRKRLLSEIEDGAEECLKIEEKEEREEEEERERVRIERKHLREIQQAIDNCDFKFFDEEMTSRERMQTYSERMACKERRGLVAGVQTTQSEEGLNVSRDELLKQIQDLLGLIVKLQAQLIAKQGG